MGTSTYDFEGTAGTVPASMGAGYGTVPWFSLPAGTSTDAAISTSQAHGGTRSVAIGSAATAANHYCSSPTATTYARLYLYLTASPSAEVTLAYVTEAGFGYYSRVALSTDRRLLNYQTVSGYTPTSAGAVPLNTWCRIEAKMTATSCESKLWTASGGGVDSTGAPDLTPETATGTTIGTLVQAGVGAIQLSTTAMFPGGTAYVDDVALSDVDWIGPSSPVAAFKRGPGITRY